jgi:signal transduction histidine kinase
MSTFASVRFRLTAIYSLLLFGLAALVVGGVYTGLARDLDDEPVSRTYQVQLVSPEGVPIRSETVRAEFQSFEHLVNRSALDQLRNYSFFALGLLFLASLGVGWFVAGRVLRPIGWITGVAREIQATDLTRRIGLGGPKDELRDLADTFDGMLDRLEAAFEAQRRLIQDASHELRNPLAVMRTNIDVVLSDPDATAEDLRRTATVVGRTTDRMSHLVDDLLSYARQGLPDQSWEPVALGGVVSETADEFRAPAAARDLRIETAITPDVRAMADRTALKQALANLVGNAVRLAPEGSTVTIASGTTGGWAYLSVADEGPGIPASDHASVFERFWSTDGGAGPSPREREHRNGLGLPIVRQIAERHGGSVALASAEGTGSTFVLWLPAIA